MTREEAIRFAECLKHNWTVNLNDVPEFARIAIEALSKPEIIRCKDCVHFDPPHVENDGKRIEYDELPKDAFDPLGTGLVNIEYGINVGGRCTVDYNVGYADDKRVYRDTKDYCSKGMRVEK